MPRFTVRVELHGAEDDREVYDRLHSTMKKHGFSRTISFGNVRYELPSAEYNRTGDSLIGKDVLEDAKAAAEEVWEDFAILVTQTQESRLRWNLKKVK
ncbi:MAG: hypothetical protein JOZ31_02210 [Verrucomicrobia bacterium]|nr:hypothetical protein [Verrucomicrobiota bacterium]